MTFFNTLFNTLFSIYIKQILRHVLNAKATYYGCTSIFPIYSIEHKLLPVL